MSTELAKRDPFDLLTVQGNVVNPDTGEVTTVEDAPTSVLVRIIGLVQHSIDQRLAMLYEAKRVLGGELIGRMDKAGQWTLNEPGVQVVTTSPTAGTVSWDAEALDEILDQLVEEGLLDREGKQRAVRPEVVLKVDKRGVDALLKIGGEVHDRINKARIVTTPGARRASVRVDPRAL